MCTDHVFLIFAFVFSHIPYIIGPFWARFAYPEITLAIILTFAIFNQARPTLPDFQRNMHNIGKHYNMGLTKRPILYCFEKNAK